MIPILFPAKATGWETQGVGALTDTLSCKVVEERNGIFELEMQYPMDGLHFESISDRCILLAIPSPYRSPQPFRIYRITRPMNGVCTIYARHISYDLAGIPLNPFAVENAPAAMAALQKNTAVQSPFTFWTDKSTAAQFSVPVPSSTRSVLGGQAGSVLDVYGGEYEWDGFAVKLWSQRGRDNGVSIRYGKNLTDIEQDRNIDNVYTGLYPYWAGSNGELVTCEPKIVPAPGAYNFTRILPIDFSGDFETVPTPSQLQKRAENYIKGNKIGVPKVSIQASFVQLEQTEEYKELALLEKCDLCDTVTIQFEKLGVDAKAEIVKIETDVLLERYTTVEIGEVRENISDTIASQGSEIKDRPTNSDLQNAVNSATEWITGTNGGYVTFRRSELGQPYEIVITDTDDIATAKKVWRWNNGGLGYSGSGYNGPYRTAITQDGSIVADFITTGTLNAALVKVVNLIVDHLQSQKTLPVGKAVKLEIDSDGIAYKIDEKDVGSLYTNVSGFSAVSTSIFVLHYPRGVAHGEMQGKTVLSWGAPNTQGEYAFLDVDQVTTPKLRPGYGQETRSIGWKRGKELSQEDWVLVGR